VPDDRELQVLIEERAITRAIHAYAHAMDSGDEVAWVEAFTDDAVFDVVEVVGGKRVHREDGRDDLAAYIAQYPKPPDFRKHVVVDPLIDVDIDAGTATVVAFWLLLAREEGTGHPITTAFGRYRDVWAKVDGRWRIKHRDADVEATLF
jgi:ketosteroid isomerase-like protein